MGARRSLTSSIPRRKDSETMNRPGTRTFASLAAALAVGAGGGAADLRGRRGRRARPSRAARRRAAAAAQPAATRDEGAHHQPDLQEGQPRRRGDHRPTSDGSSNGYPFGGGTCDRAGVRLRLRQGRPHRHEPARRRRRDDRSQVKLSNGKTYRATVVGTDTSTDLAVAEGRRAGFAAPPGRARRLLGGRGRRRRRRDRQPVRPRGDDHGRHRQRAEPPDPGDRTASRSAARSRRTRRSTTATPAARSST